MKRLIKWCNWELYNEFLACGYFTVMVFMYGIIVLILGKKEINVIILFEMYFINYALSTLQKILLDSQKEYSKRTFLTRATFLSILSAILVAIVSSIGGWFHGMPIWSGALIISMLLLSYITVWVILSLSKKYDSKQLNDQLANYKRKHQN